jgi:dTDP-4-amino-4,6-dideoxygalactose transaminase
VNIPFFDLSRQNARIRDEIEGAVMGVIDSGRFVFGPAVTRLEDEVSGRLGVRHGVGVASGSDALLLALMALGVGPGAEVIVPAFSFFSTASAAHRLGARLIFADIDPQSFQMDPEDMRRRITPRTRAVILAHLFGDCADAQAIGDLAAGCGAALIEDAAQAFGALRQGKPAGSFGTYGCLSFYPTKNLGAFGDGGMVVTDSNDLAQEVRQLANHGIRNRYEHVRAGINSRLDALQAAILSVKLRHVDTWNRRRQDIAHRYSAALGDRFDVPSPSPENVPVYHQYVIRSPERDSLREHLTRRGVGTEIYYPIPLHLQPGLETQCREGDFPGAEQAARTALALPIFPELEDVEADRVIEAVLEFR